MHSSIFFKFYAKHEVFRKKVKINYSTILKKRVRGVCVEGGGRITNS